MEFHKSKPLEPSTEVHSISVVSALFILLPCHSLVLNFFSKLSAMGFCFLYKK